MRERERERSQMLSTLLFVVMSAAKVLSLKAENTGEGSGGSRSFIPIVVVFSPSF